jgi:hypothetical protein
VRRDSGAISRTSWRRHPPRGSIDPRKEVYAMETIVLLIVLLVVIHRVMA